MKEYSVIWQIDIEAETAEDAARQALAIHRDPHSIATVFQVAEVSLDHRGNPVDGDWVLVDLKEKACT